MTDQELIQETLASPDFPKRHINAPSYVENGRVYQDFVNTGGKPMRRYFHFGLYNLDGEYVEPPFERGEIKILVWGAEFINIGDAIDCYFANVSPKQLDMDMKRADWEYYSDKAFDLGWMERDGAEFSDFILHSPKAQLDEFFEKSGFNELVKNPPQDPRKE